jgi:hypothetical protein
MPDKKQVGAPSVATQRPGFIAEPSTVPQREHGRDLRVRELAWVMQVTEYSARKLCESGEVPAWRAVDLAGSSARLRWNVPTKTLAPLLKSAMARRRLEMLSTGRIVVVRSAAQGDQRAPSNATRGSLASSDIASVSALDWRSDTSVSHVRK